jgi:hypothetical protein
VRGVLLWLVGGRPRRPRLAQIAGRAAVSQQRAAAAAWIGGQIQLLESAVPGLDRAGLVIDDGCWLSRNGRGWVIDRTTRWQVQGTRSVTAVYAAGGQADAWLADLAAAAAAAGWGYYGFADPLARLRELLVVPFSEGGRCQASPGWRPRPGAGPPPGWHRPANPHAVARTVHMSIQAELRQPASPADARAGYRSLRDRRWPGPPAQATALHQPLEWTEADVATLASQAFAMTSQVAAVTITVIYYEHHC